MAKKYGALLVMNTDTHSPENLLSAKTIKKILKESDLKTADFKIMQKNSSDIVKRKGD